MAKAAQEKAAPKKGAAAKEDVAKRGRPSLYTAKLADEICCRIAGGETLSQICRDDYMPARSTIAGWVLDNYQNFSGKYARAKDLQLDYWADETIDIADDSSNDWIERETEKGRLVEVPNTELVQRARLRIDSRKWLLSKLKPERYGDSLKLSGDLNLNHKTDEQLQTRLEQLLANESSDG